MTNKELAKIFYQIADFLKADNIQFKPYAYRKAAMALENLREDVGEIYKKEGLKGLEEIPGVGRSIAQKIEEYLKTGRVRYYQKLKKRLPVNIEELMSIEGMGAKKAKILYEKLGIKNLKDMERAAKLHRIAPLFGFGKKTEENILEGIGFVKKSKGRFLLGDILPRAREISEKLKRVKGVKRVDIAGSLRRRKETIGDIDFLVISKSPAGVMDFFLSLPGIIKVWGRGLTKSSVRMREGFDIDLRVVPEKSYGSALQYFTGSKDHNIATRKIAIEKGLKLNEYGVFKGKKMIAGKTEREVYRAIGLPLFPPEMRLNRGEIEAAQAGRLPRIIGYNDIRGDLHCHIKWRKRWDGGANTILEMAEAAMKMGYQYLGIASHTRFLRIEYGLNEKQLEARDREIERLNSGFRARGLSFRVLRGCEANIMKDGSIDIRDQSLRKLDFVIAGIHSNFKMAKGKMTERIIRAMKNPHVDIISHPTGRILQKREAYQIDLEKILRAAKEFGVVLEINSSPLRLDLNDSHIREAKRAGVKMAINTDSHHRDQLKNIEFGIAQARRGWAEKKDIINAWPLEKLLKVFRK